MTLAPTIRIFCLSAVLMAGTAHAQSTEQKVQGYVPPPMFGAPPAAQPRPAAPIVVPGRTSAPRDVSEPVGTTPAPYPPVSANGDSAPSTPSAELPAFVRPRISRPNEEGPVKVEPYIPKFPPMAPVPMEDTPAGRGQIVDRPRVPLAPPIPQKKPPVPAAKLAATQAAPANAIAVPPAPVPVPADTAPVTPPSVAPTAPAPIQTPVAAPPPAPVPAQTPAPAPAAAAPQAVAQPTPPVQTPVAAQPAYKVTSKGVVTGPKTMPSVPTGGVEKETTFAANAATPGKTLLEQHAERQQADDDNGGPANDTPAIAPEPAPAGFVPVAQIVPVDASKSRMTLAFTGGKDDLAEDQRLTIKHNIIPILLGDNGQRIQILAYATAIDGAQNSDRRIALSRALAIRSVLIDQGVEPRRIDVRALGATPGEGPADRVELILSAL